ncbi:MAG: transposase, partial [Moritella sp.]|nr:transposase [Moritella sp.]
YQCFELDFQREVPDRLKSLRAFFPYMQKELRRPGVNRTILWEEYIVKHSDGYGKTQFNEHYNLWRNRTSPSMRINHKAGDKLYVDYTGKKLQVIDPQTGEIKQVEVFVSILGASQLIYAEATISQQKQDFVTSI